jgi:transposase-like protein
VSKKVPVVKITTADVAGELVGLPLQATVAMADVAGAMRDGLLAFATAAGLVVMQQMLSEELTGIVGEKHARLGSERVGNWHGTTTGQVVLGSQKVTVGRPRGRYVDGGEVELATWETFASEDLLRQVVVERMLAGVATRRHVDVTEPVGPVHGKAVSRSAVSRRFKAATEAAMGDLLARDLTALETAVLMIDGLNVADQMIVVALIITADGTKVLVGLMLGDTENHVVVKDLLADLVARGLRYEHGILAVLDGSKALRKAVTKVCFGERALVQRCTYTSDETSSGTCPSTSATPSTGASPKRSPAPIRPRACRPARTSPSSSTARTPTPPPPCAKRSRRCSPSPGSASPAGYDDR